MSAKPLVRLETIKDGSAIVIEAQLADGPGEIIVARRGERAWAYRNRCPHFSVGLDAQPGVLHTWRGLLMCAHHSAMFRFEDGFCVDGPCMGHALDQVVVSIHDGHVLLDVASSAAAGADSRRSCATSHSPETTD